MMYYMIMEYMGSNATVDLEKQGMSLANLVGGFISVLVGAEMLTRDRVSVHK